MNQLECTASIKKKNKKAYLSSNSQSGFLSVFVKNLEAGKVPLLAILLLSILTGCAQTSTQNTNGVNDPLEPLNRGVAAFNYGLDQAIMRPLAIAYVTVTPDFIETGISNFFDNAAYPTVFINQFLQGKFDEGFEDTGRFLVNSTIGIGGLFDIATDMGLESHDEDFGQTLAVWGIDSDMYLVVPFFGPTTLTDGIGSIADSYTYLPRYIEDVPTRNSVLALGVIDTRAGFLSLEQLISGDKYLFARDAYLQQREFLITDGEQESDPFLD